MKTFSVKEVCKSCKGTGLYVGLAESNGSAVVCHRCKGTGCHEFVHKYEEFTERQKSHNVSRVFQVNPGICIGINDNLRLEDFGGIPIIDWEEGKPFPAKSEDRKHTCPAWWYQSADYKKKPSWDKCLGCGSFYGCKHFDEKHKCWERWDQENKGD